MTQDPQPPPTPGMSPPLPLWWLPLLAGTLTLFTIHVSYLIAAAQGHVAWCFPYLDSCTSISATGRQWPERAVFKPLMTLSALLVAGSFWAGARWLAMLENTAPAATRTQRALPRIGLLVLLCIVAYTAALGEAGNAAKLLRKIGVTLGFGLTYLGEILLLARIAALRQRQPGCMRTPLYHALLAILALTLILGITSVVLAAFHPGYARMDDAFEWTFALLLNLWLVVLAFVWRDNGFTLQPGVRLR